MAVATLKESEQEILNQDKACIEELFENMKKILKKYDPEDYRQRDTISEVRNLILKNTFEMVSGLESYIVCTGMDVMAEFMKFFENTITKPRN